MPYCPFGANPSSETSIHIHLYYLKMDVDGCFRWWIGTKRATNLDNLQPHIDGLVKNFSIFSVLTMEIRQSCTKPSIYIQIGLWWVHSALTACDHYIIFITDSDEDHQASVRQLATSFSAMTERQAERSNNIVDELASILRVEAPNCAFVQLFDGKGFPKAPKPPPVPCITDAAKSVTPCESEEDNIKSLSEAIQLTEEQRSNIEVLTRAQSASTDWKTQRAGRITASSMKRVYTRVASLQNDSHQDAAPLVRHIMGYDDYELGTLAIKHGRSVEPHAKSLYARAQKKKHKGFSTVDSGLVILAEKPYVAASPDLIVSCKCCGKGACEIKCPYMCRTEVPSPDNWPHITRSDDGSVKLSCSSQYMFQIQGQMGCLGVQYCDLFVYTARGYHLERIEFNPGMWKDMMERFDYFFCNHLGPELLSGSLRYKAPENCASGDHCYSTQDDLIVGASQDRQPQQLKKSVLTSPSYPNVRLCGMCGLDCLYSPECFGDRSIQCTECRIWLHFHCLNVHPDDKLTVTNWICTYCCKWSTYMSQQPCPCKHALTCQHQAGMGLMLP